MSPFPMSCTFEHHRGGRVSVAVTIFDPADNTVQVFTVEGSDGGTVTHRAASGNDRHDLRDLRAEIDGAIRGLDVSLPRFNLRDLLP